MNETLKGWLAWLALCAGVEAAVLVFATAKAVSSPHYSGRSVVVAALIVFGIEIVLTVIGSIFIICEPDADGD